ncbi:amino acid ABC transporter substrate-binding protein [Zhihengliuella salsuginis]|uniref:L-cystine-binding protein TcyA n=1 Tax=Zhihengliuella salsuginis TaxID=578222 RepID=A0ABQ3GFP9_9MICC|nr:amino acid ABC transporter substrate-binding protein [Zhihengliuella salsuginis]GHD02548.1 L-cystine-binding protein TcyA [Zhihengliuella salsuginis]
MTRFLPSIPLTRRALGLAAAAGAALALAACGSTGSETGGEPAEASASGVTWESVQESGKLTIGTEGTYRPFSYHEGGDGELTGYDVEVARAVGEKLGVEIEFAETQWDAMFAGLNAGRFDAVANQVTMTPDRMEEYLFSTPYTVSTGVIVTLADNDSITSFDDLESQRTAQSRASNWYTLAVDSGAEVEPVEGWAQSVTLLEQGRVDATINDKLTVLDYQKTEDNQNIKIAAETEETSEVAFAFPKGSESVVEQVDSALAELAADGTLAEISTEYFGEDVSQ